MNRGNHPSTRKCPAKWDSPKSPQTIVPDINALEPELAALSDDGLRGKTTEFRQRLASAQADGVSVDDAMNDMLIEAFAVVREGAKRVIGQRHYDVQLMGGAALH